MGWFNKKKKEEKYSRQKMRDALQKREDAVDRLVEKIDKRNTERRWRFIPFNGEDRRVFTA